MHMIESGRQGGAVLSDQFAADSAEGKRIVHQVTRFDTLAGVAIKYGVEVADIKRMNGLVTDRQMFARKKLQIPLPGRHPISHRLSNDSSSNGYHTPPRRCHNDAWESIQSLGLKSQQQKVSSAMSRLQGYYGLATKMHLIVVEGTEMAVYRNTQTSDPEKGTWKRSSPHSEPPFGRHRKSRSYANGFFLEPVDLREDVEPKDHLESDRYQNEASVRRRQKTGTDAELLMKEESGGIFVGRSSNGMAPRPKSSNRIDSDTARLMTIAFGDSFMANSHSLVRKSSSTSNLQESDNTMPWAATRQTSKGDVVSRQIFAKAVDLQKKQGSP